MNILFYLEPHPIRNSFFEFRGVAINQLKTLLTQAQQSESINFRIFGNKTTLKEVAKRCQFEEASYLYPLDEQEEFFQSQYCEWDEGGIERWKELMSPDCGECGYTNIIEELHQRYPFDYIINWGTNTVVKNTAKKLGVGYVNMELGCSRPPYSDSFVADPWGVNGQSVLSKAHIDDFENVEVTSNATQDLFRFSHSFPSYAFSAGFVPIGDSNLLAIDKTRKIAFIPLQLYDDANLIMYSPYNEVIDVLQDILPPLTQAGYTCIIKEHPASRNRKGSLEANAKAKEYADQFENLIWIDCNSGVQGNAFFYKLCDLVVTVNSSVGFESFFYEKPLVVLGEAVYKVAGVFSNLREYLNGAFDKELYCQQIAKIRSFFYQAYLLDDSLFQDLENFTKVIQFVGDLSKQDLSTKQIIDSYLEFSKKRGAESV